MKKRLYLWQLCGVIFSLVFGVLLHFLYEWSENNYIVSIFSGVNESTWEHMKLLFFPMFIFAIIQSFFFKNYDNFWKIKLKGILLGLLLIPLLYYFYNGVIGDSPDWINIIIFSISVIVSYLYEIRLFNMNKSKTDSSVSCFVTLAMIALLFAVFTFYPLSIEIFKDPTTGLYGINN